MKTIISIVVCFCMIFGIFTGCTKTVAPDEKPVKNVTISQTKTETGLKESKWEFALKETENSLPFEVSNVFSYAVNDEKDDYVPVAYIARRESDEGIFYRILCQVSPKTTDSRLKFGELRNSLCKVSGIPVDESKKNEHDSIAELLGHKNKCDSELVIVDLLTDLNAKTSIYKIESYDLDVEMSKTEEEINDETVLMLSEGWLKNSNQPTSTIEKKVIDLFNETVKEDSHSYEALTLLGHKETNKGTNYAFLCRKVANENIPFDELVIVFIFVSENSSEIVNVITI